MSRQSNFLKTGPWVLSIASLVLGAGGCGSQPSTAQAEPADCAVGMIADYGPSEGVSFADPEEALQAWLKAKRSDLEASSSAYLKENPEDKALIADQAALDALQSAESVISRAEVKVLEKTIPRTAHVVGIDERGRSVDITLTGGYAEDPVVWQVTGYSIDLDASWCSKLPKKER